MPVLANMLVRVGVVGASGFDRDFKRAQRSVKAFSRDLEEVGQTLTVAFTLPLIAAGVAIVRAGAQFDGLRRGLIAVSGSAEEAERQLVRLREVAKAPGLGFKEAIQGSTALQASGFSAALAERSLKAFANALATVGKGKADLDGVTLALTQIIAAGKATGQEIRQLQQRLPQIRQAMIAAFGSGRSDEIVKLGINAEQFVEGIVTEFEKLPPVTSGLKNELENLSDSVEIALADAGRAATPFAQVMIRELEKVIEKTGEAAQEFRKLPEETQSNLLKTAVAIAAAPIAVLVTAQFIKAFTVIEGFLIGSLIPAFLKATTTIGARLIPGIIAIGPAAAGASLAVLGLKAAIVTATVVAAAFSISNLVTATLDLLDAQSKAADAEDALARSTSILETRLRQAGVNTKELRQEWIRGVFGARSWNQALNLAAAAVAKYLHGVQEATDSQEDNADALKRQLAAQIAAKEAAERLAEAYSALRISSPDNLEELRESLRLVSREFDAGEITVRQYVDALNAYRKAVADVTFRPLEVFPSPITAGVGPPLDFGVLEQVENFRQGREAISELVNAYNEGVLSMTQGTLNFERSLALFAPSLANLQRQLADVRIEEFAEKLGVTLTRDLQETRDEAQQLFDEITTSAESTAVDRLKVTQRLLEAEIALWRELAVEATGADAKSLEAHLKNLEKRERETRSVLNRITGANKRSTDEVARFWRGMGRQVSSIINDLAREITDILFPRSQPNQRDIAGITDLGIRAGVTGDQLEALAATIEALALATGQSFSTLADSAADIFQSFTVDADRQIALLEEFFDIAVGGNIRITDLLRTLDEGSGILTALGIGAREGAALIARLTTEGLDADEIFSNLQETLDNLTQQGFARPADELQEIIDRIRNAGTVAEANALSIVHFGDAGVDMARIIRSGALDVAGLAEAFADAGNNISDAAAEVRQFEEDVQGTSNVKRIFEEIGRSITRALAEEGVRAVVKLITQLDLLKVAGTAIKNVFLTILDKLGLIEKAAGTVFDKLPTNIPIGGGGANIPGIPTTVPGGTIPGVPGGGSAGQAISGLAGTLTAVGALGSFATGIVGIFQARAHGAFLDLIEQNTRATAIGMIGTAGLVDTSREFLPNLKDINDYLWKVQADIFGQIHDRLIEISRNTSNFGAPPLAFAGGQIPNAAPVQSGDISINNLNIDGINVDNPAFVRDVTKAIARHNIARGVRNRRGVR